MPSYSPVYSQGFIYNTEAAPNTTFDVPAGFTAVIHEFTLVTIAGEGVAYLRVQNSLSAPLVNVAILSLAGLLESDDFKGRIVVPGGGVISIYDQNVGTSNDIYVGGYLLRDNLT